MKTNNLPTIKIYKIDYEFILKNYTSPELWDEKWILLIYKNYNFSLFLKRIDVENKQIIFGIRLESDLNIWFKNVSTEFNYNIKNMDIKFLQKLINSKMLWLIESLEENYIEEADEKYQEIKNTRQDEIDTLTQIAKDFLDENGVTNDEIRDVYISHYVDKNEEIWQKLIEYKEIKKYTYLTDLYLIFSEITENPSLKQDVRNAQENDISDLEKEINDYMKQLENEDYINEMKNNLEVI